VVIGSNLAFDKLLKVCRKLVVNGTSNFVAINAYMVVVNGMSKVLKKVAEILAAKLA
jgi:hypothetical protein